MTAGDPSFAGSRLDCGGGGVRGLRHRCSTGRWGGCSAAGVATVVFFYGAGAALRPLAIRLANRQRCRRSSSAHQRRSKDPYEYNWKTEAAASG